MGELIKLPVSSDIVTFFIETPQLHNPVLATLSDEEEKDWFNGECDSEAIIAANTIYFDRQNEEGFFIENSQGRVLALVYKDEQRWHHMILNDIQQAEFMDFLKMQGEKVPNIHEIAIPRMHHFLRREKKSKK